jgi:prepilin-type N-terminal cleavage/methylation domain-containing protein
MSRRSTGFTLLEVLAAVAIIAIIFTTLARVASEGLRSEGTSRRRLEASLIADQTLAEIETAFAIGTAPQTGESEGESENGLFSVVTAISDFDIESAIPSLAPGESEPTVVSNLAAILGIDDPSATPSLAGVLGDGVSPVREVRITVTWTEGVNDFSVIRTTYGLDRTALEGIAGAAGTPGTPGGLPQRVPGQPRVGGPTS